MQNIDLVLMALGALLIVSSVLLGRRREAAPPPTPPALLRSDVTPESIVELQAYLIELLRDLHELSADMTADLDARLAELKDALEEADNKIDEIAAAGIGKERIPEPKPEEPKPEEPEPEPAADLSAPERASTTPAQRLEEPEERARGNAAAPPPGRYAEIYQMDDIGASIDEIARRMSMGKGEIQLILSLRENN